MPLTNEGLGYFSTVPEFTRLNSRITLKCTAEVEAVFIADQLSDHLDLHVRIVKEQPLGFVHSQLRQIFGRSFPRIFLEYFPQILRRKSEFLGQLLKGDIVRIVFLKIDVYKRQE